jgi:hypothetical protein
LPREWNHIFFCIYPWFYFQVIIKKLLYKHIHFINFLLVHFRICKNHWFYLILLFLNLFIYINWWLTRSCLSPLVKFTLISDKDIFRYLGYLFYIHWEWIKVCKISDLCFQCNVVCFPIKSSLNKIYFLCLFLLFIFLILFLKRFWGTTL